MAVGNEADFEKIGGEEVAVVVRVLLDADDKDSAMRHPDDSCL